MKDEEIRIKIRDNKIITLEELFKGKQRTRKKMANLPFEKKINMLISLQETARSWGGIKDLLIWKNLHPGGVKKYQKVGQIPKRYLSRKPDEDMEWLNLTPAQRMLETTKLWKLYIALGGGLDPEPDTQSPFYFEKASG